MVSYGYLVGIVAVLFIYVVLLLELHLSICFRYWSIVLCWIPSHVGISGNEKADTAAKSALSLHVTPMKIPAADLVPRVTMLISEKWQQFWNSCTGNKLQAIRPTVGNGHQPKPSLSRRDEVVVNRHRIGHTRCTHSYLLTGADQPECTTCQCPLTVKHILVDCLNFNDTRNKHFVASSMEELFRTADVHNILDFTKETHFKASYDVYKHFYSSYLALILR